VRSIADTPNECLLSEDFPARLGEALATRNWRGFDTVLIRSRQTRQEKAQNRHVFDWPLLEKQAARFGARLSPASDWKKWWARSDSNPGPPACEAGRRKMHL